jgi:FkbM family methyltransferase
VRFPLPRNPKLYAAYVLAQFVRWLKNWRAVWSAYRANAPLPPFEFRSGFTVNHQKGDDPVMLLLEIFAGECYRRYLRKPVREQMIDIGSNIGMTTLDFTQRESGLVVHAFEPNPTTRKTLTSNIESNGLGGRVHIHPEAVGREHGQLELRFGDHSGVASGYGHSGVGIKVPMIDLNEAVTGSISLLKIDAEGAEADILEGARVDTLQRIDQVILEYHENFCPGVVARCVRALEAAGFRCDVHAIAPEQGLLYACR